MTIEERLSALMETSDRTAVIEISGKRWFCDGRIIVRAEFLPLEAEPKKNWVKGITKYVQAVPSDYVVAECGAMRGTFKDGYVRHFRVKNNNGETHTEYLQEKYVRIIPEGTMALAGIQGKALYFVDGGGEICAILMPMRVCGIVDLARLPEIPFVEDEVLYHVCKCEDSE